MIKPVSLPSKAIQILTDRLADEQQEFYFYVSASAWCRLNGYENSARYFEVESHGEEYHYKRIVSFLTSWNEEAKFQQIDKPIQQFSSLADVFEQAYKMETRIQGLYDSDAKTIWPIDQNVYVFLQGFVSMQADAVTGLNAKLKKMYDYQADDPKLITFDKEEFVEYSNLYY